MLGTSVRAKLIDVPVDGLRQAPAGICAIVIVMITYAITTLLQGLFGSIPINRLVGFSLMALLAYEWAATRKSHASYVVALGFMALSLRSATVMVNASQEVSDWVYLASTLLILGLVTSASSREGIRWALDRYRRYILLVVMGSILLLLGLLITRTGYVSAWGEEPYFKGLCNSEHTLASICTLLLVLIVFLARTGASRSVCVISSVVVLYALLETGARTYLIPASICMLFLIDGLVERRWAKGALIVLVFFSFAVVFASSGMASKFDFVQSNVWTDSLLNAFTNGRDEIWMTDLAAWADSGPLGFLMGNSFSAIYKLNMAKLSLTIWAHNDLIMVLFGAGLIGLSLYLGVLIYLLKTMCGTLRAGDFLLLAVFVLFPLLLNGFFPYQHLVYAFVLLYAACSSSETLERR